MAKPSKASASRELAKYEKQMLEDANAAASQEASALGGGYFSIKGGLLSFGGNEIPGSQMAVIVLDSMFLNQYFDGPYVEGQQRSPVCWAKGHGKSSDLEHHEKAEDPQHDGVCDDCPMNRFGSADTGKGKACKNGRRLALISAGDLSRDGEQVEMLGDSEILEGSIGWFNLPPTSLQAYATWVESLRSAFKRAPYAFVCKIVVKPHQTKQVVVTFNTMVDLYKEAPELIPGLIERAKKAFAENEKYEPMPNEEADEPAPRTQQRRSGQAAGREPTGRTTGARRGNGRVQPEEPPRKAGRTAAPARRPRAEPVEEPAPRGGTRAGRGGKAAVEPAQAQGGDKFRRRAK